MNIILWELSLKRQSTLQALSTPTSRFQELLASPRRARTCSHCHLRNFLRFLGARRGFADEEILSRTSQGSGRCKSKLNTTTQTLKSREKQTQSHTCAGNAGRGCLPCWLLPFASLVPPTGEPLAQGSPSPNLGPLSPQSLSHPCPSLLTGTVSSETLSLLISGSVTLETLPLRQVPTWQVVPT